MANFKAVIFKGAAQLKNDGTTNIKIRITHSRKADYISTELFVNPESFDLKSGRVKSGKNKDYINLRITDYIQKYQRKDIELGDRRELMTVKQIKSHILDKNENSRLIDFFEFADDYLKTVSSEGTLRWHESTLINLKNFAKDRLAFSEINLNFLQNFERYLLSQGVKGGINNYMRSFRALFNKARDKFNDEDSGVIKIPHYPFRKYRMPVASSKSKKHFLTPDELILFINYPPSKKSEEFAKDMFLLMFYLIGIETKDLYHLNRANKGRIDYERFKTGKDFSIKLEPEALELIKKYHSKTNLINVNEKYSNHQYLMKFINEQLHGAKARKVKGIFPKLGIDKPVTTKWARHTWATIARNNCRINKDDVALCLGHDDADNRVTDIYVDYDYSIIDDSNRMVLDFIKKYKVSTLQSN